MDEIFGSVILEYIGAYTKWVIQFFISKIKKKRVVSVKQILNGKRGMKEYDLIMQGWSNIFVGAAVILIIAASLVIIGFK